jgi:hypothetical protein
LLAIVVVKEGRETTLVLGIDPIGVISATPRMAGFGQVAALGTVIIETPFWFKP